MMVVDNEMSTNAFSFDTSLYYLLKDTIQIKVCQLGIHRVI